MPKVAVYRVEHFNAAHRLHVPEWSDAVNTRVLANVIILTTTGIITN